MRRLFTAWAAAGADRPHALTEGPGPPRFADGSPQPDCDVCAWAVEVGTAEEAAAVFHLRCGYGPYRPMGDPAPCPGCGAAHYPAGSGQSWRCDHRG